MLRRIAATALGAVVLSLAGLGLLGSQADAGPPGPSEEQREYDHFLFIRHNYGAPKARAYTLVMARVAPSGVVLRDVCNISTGGFFFANLLWVTDGKAYLLHYIPYGNSLISIDLETGKTHQMASGISHHYFRSGKLYCIQRLQGRSRLSVYDLASRAFREIMPLRSSLFHLASPPGIVVSPDQQRLAYFEFVQPFVSPFRLNVADLEAGAIEQPCQPIEWIQAGDSTIGGGPPFVWLDPETILFARTHFPPGNITWHGRTLSGSVDYLTTINVLTGETADIAKLPGEPYVYRVSLTPPSESLRLDPVVEIAGGRHSGRYRVDLKSRKLIEEERIGGDYRVSLAGGAEGLYHGSKLLGKATYLGDIGVSPDGKRIMWQERSRDGRARLCYHDVEAQAVQTVASGEFGHSFLWFTAEDLGPQVPREIPPGWFPLESYPRPEKPVEAARKPSVPEKRLKDYLTFTLSSDKDRYRLHEPVQLTLTISNKGDVDFEMLRPSLYYQCATLHMEFETPEGISGTTLIDRYVEPDGGTVVLKPGQTMSAVEQIELSDAADYQIKGQFRGLKGTLNTDLHFPRNQDWHSLESPAILLSVEDSPDRKELIESKVKRTMARVRASESRERGDLLSILGDVGDIGPDAVPYLIVAIEEGDEDNLLWALWKTLIRRVSPQALSFYEESLTGGSALARPLAASGLFMLYHKGTPAKDEALQLLIEALATDDALLRRKVAGLLMRVRSPLVERAFEAAVEDPDLKVSTMAAGYLAALEAIPMADWFARAADEPNLARYLAATHIIGELEKTWHTKKGDLPDAPWSTVSQSPEMLDQFRQTLLAWSEWAAENPRASASYLDSIRSWWIRSWWL